MAPPPLVNDNFVEMELPRRDVLIRDRQVVGLWQPARGEGI